MFQTRPYPTNAQLYSKPKCKSLFLSAACSSISFNSNQTPSWKYHAFLSFRGEIRNSFSDHLHAALCRKGFVTFRDDKNLPKGEVIDPELLKAIEESLVSIVLLSQDYASSRSCLTELQHIMKCRKTLGRGVLPVFYNIEPSIVKFQTGSFAEALKKHEKRSGEGSSEIQSWRNALSEVGHILGPNSKNRSETELIEEIITELWKRVEPYLPSYSKDGLVEIDTKLEDMYQILEIGSSDVRFVGIWGMGGIGKTTLAKLVFNQFRSYFDISCCIENVREKSSPMDGLLGLQIKLLSKLKIKGLEIDNLDQGKATIKNFLSQRKVLLLLDDVDEGKQLEYLAGNIDWFCQGSRVLVTTRDMRLLELHEAPFRKYEIEVLNPDESLELFCQNAFKRKQPKEGFLELSKTVVRIGQGLPLALEVLGRRFYKREISLWEDVIDRIKKDPPKDILNTLMISYEGLEDAEKTIFLDIACFFKGWHKKRVIQILENCGFNPKIGVQILIERSLLKCDNKCFWMHDLLQEMGKKIVIQKSGNEISKQSRLWSSEDVDKVLKKNKATEFIQGIVLGDHNYEACWDPNAFVKMCNLRMLIILHGFPLSLGLKCLSDSIKVLEWNEYPLESLPHCEELNNLVELKMHGSRIKQLWNGIHKFEDLKFIDLSYSEHLIRSPNFVEVKNLESLILKGCSNLVEIHESIGQLGKLVVLHLKDCINLKYLPSKLETNFLKDLNLCGCSKVQNLPELNKCVERLDISGTAIVEVPSFVGGLQNLESFSVRGCRGQLSEPQLGLKLPSLSGLRMLIELDASYCNLSGESIPDINCFPSLKKLSLSGNNFSRNSILMRSKFSQFSGLSKLEELELNNCSLNDESIPDINCLPSSLKILRLSGNNFSRNSIFSQFSGLSKLEELELNNCSLNDESIPDDLNYLPSLRGLELSGNNFVNLPLGCISSLTSLMVLELDSCPKLQTLPMFPPSLISVFARNCGPIAPLSETQIWRLLMPAGRRSSMPVTISGNEISPWFEKQKDVSSFWKFESFQDSIIVDIPDCCLSEQWEIAFCFIVEPPNNADLNEERVLPGLTWMMKFDFDLPTLEAAPPRTSCGWCLPVYHFRDLNYNVQFILVLDYDLVSRGIIKKVEHVGNHQAWLRKVLRDGGNRLQLLFGACRIIHKDWQNPFDNLNIRKCGWRVICEHEMRRKPTMSDFENIPSNSSGFKESRLTEIKDGKRGGDEFEGEDAFVSDDESKLEHNETQRKKLE